MITRLLQQERKIRDSRKPKQRARMKAPCYYRVLEERGRGAWREGMDRRVGQPLWDTRLGLSRTPVLAHQRFCGAPIVLLG